MKILFIGESWFGSCARSLREALARRTDVAVDDVSEDAWFPRPRALSLRLLNRVTSKAYRREFNREVMERVEALQPDVVMTYKGHPVHADLIDAIRALGTRTVNVYPDHSPHGHGVAHAYAVGRYDLVISTKPYHPPNWADVYGYRNRCVFVPQGYDPHLHLVDTAPDDFKFDVLMIASQRPAYESLMIDLARELRDDQVSVGVGGARWEGHQSKLPAHWRFLGNISGQRYVSALRRGRVCIAPLSPGAKIGDRATSGDVDTTRTYELAAGWCFFIHRRTEYVQSLYDEATEVPMFDNAAELARKIRYYLAHPEERVAMAAAAHRRAVPNYSIDYRAGEIVEILNSAW